MTTLTESFNLDKMEVQLQSGLAQYQITTPGGPIAVHELIGREFKIHYQK